MENKEVLSVLAAIAHESRLAIFRLLVQIGQKGMATTRIAERQSGEEEGQRSAEHL
jgi:DNA-binding transcriptional ArsR family regulator